MFSSESLAESSNSELNDLRSQIQDQLDKAPHQEHAISNSKKQTYTQVSKYDVTKPIALIDPQWKILNKAALLQLRRRHEPDWVACAVRRAFYNPVTHAVQNAMQNMLKEPSLRQQLIKRMIIVRYEAKMQVGSTAGVSCQVRHIGEVTATTSDTRTEQKHTLQSVSAKVSHYIFITSH
jgi:hypothetical protein